MEANMNEHNSTSHHFGAKIKVSQSTLNYQLLQTIEAISRRVVDESLKEAGKHITPAWSDALCLHVDISMDFSKSTLDKDVIFKGFGVVSLTKEVDYEETAELQKKAKGASSEKRVQ